VTPKKFYDWQTAGGTDDVMRMVDCRERADIAWCAIDGVAVPLGGRTDGDTGCRPRGCDRID